MPMQIWCRIIGYYLQMLPNIKHIYEILLSNEYAPSFVQARALLMHVLLDAEDERNEQNSLPTS